MIDLISRQAAIDLIENDKIDGDSPFISLPRAQVVNRTCDRHVEGIKNLPSAQPTLYGYKIEHLALVARVMQKEGVSPEKAVECFTDIVRIVQMFAEEQKEIIKRTVEEWKI